MKSTYGINLISLLYQKYRIFIKGKLFILYRGIIITLLIRKLISVRIKGNYWLWLLGLERLSCICIWIRLFMGVLGLLISFVRRIRSSSMAVDCILWGNIFHLSLGIPTRPCILLFSTSEIKIMWFWSRKSQLMSTPLGSFSMKSSPKIGSIGNFLWGKWWESLLRKILGPSYLIRSEESSRP